VPSENHHDRVLSGKRRCVALDEGFIDFHAQDRDPVVMKLFIRLQSSELVLDGVGMIWARFFEELLKVVLRLLGTCCRPQPLRHVRRWSRPPAR
jgi:hypothetical protein